MGLCALRDLSPRVLFWNAADLLDCKINTSHSEGLRKPTWGWTCSWVKSLGEIFRLLWDAAMWPHQRSYALSVYCPLNLVSNGDGQKFCCAGGFDPKKHFTDCASNIRFGSLN